MRWYSPILIAICSMMLGCSTSSRALLTSDVTPPAHVEKPTDQTFLGNVNDLRGSEGFRQNVWLSSNGSLGAICMDLDHQLYLVVVTEWPIRPLEQLSERFRCLQTSIAELRKKMDSDAFILDEEGIDWICRIPPDATESFAADLFNELCGLTLKASDISFQWD